MRDRFADGKETNEVRIGITEGRGKWNVKKKWRRKRSLGRRKTWPTYQGKIRI